MEDFMKKAKLYFPIPLVIAIVCTYLAKWAILRFINRVDLCDYIQTNKDHISVFIPIFMFLFFIVIFCAILCIPLIYHMKKRKKV